MKMPFHIGKSPAKKKGTTNNSGAILALVVIVLVIANILGAGLLSQSTMNAVEVVKNVQSNQAFWIAEGGLGMAISNLPDVPETNPFSGTLGEGGYNVTLTPISAYRWTIESVGTVNRETRRIRVIVVVRTEVTTAIMASGDLKVTGTADINGPQEPNTTPCFEDVFGVTKEEMQDYATYEYTDPSNNETPVEGITWIINDFQITTEGWEGSGIMVVTGDLKMTGAKFDGIIWVVGSLDIAGNTKINGSIFVEGNATVDITGTAEVSFDQSEIDDALSNLSTVLSWQEF